MSKRIFGLSFAALFMISSFAAVPASAETVEWSEPLVIGEDTGFEASEPSIAANDLGWQIAAWPGWDGSQYIVYANRFEPETGWGEPEAMSKGYHAVDAGIDDAGNAMVVWTVDTKVMVRTYVQQNHTWDDGMAISDTGRRPFDVQISVNGNGGAVAKWMDGGSVYASIRDPSLSWGAAELVQQGVYYPSVAIDDNMNAICVYRTYDGTKYDVHAKRYSIDQGWGPEILIGTQIRYEYICRPVLAMNGEGAAIAAWHSLIDSHYVTCANVYAPDSNTWEGVTPIEDPTVGSSILVDVDVDDNGEAVAAWRLEGATGTPTRIRANLYNPVSGWSGPATIGEVVGPVSGVPVDLEACAVADGGAYVAWNDHTWFYPSTWNLYANHYDQVDGWVGMSTITETVNISRIDIAPNHLGGATVAWAGSYDEMQWYNWDVCVSSCSGAVSGNPVAVMDVSDKNNNWKTWRFDGRASTDDVGIVEYLWDFGDGTYADNKVACHTYQKAGEYLVTLTVWDGDGNSDSTTTTITVTQSSGGT